MTFEPGMPYYTALNDSPLSDRQVVLSDLTQYVERAWASFDHPRPTEPRPDQALLERLRADLPEEPSDAKDALRDAVDILDASISPSRPLYLAYVGSTGLESGMLASALSAVYDVNLAAAAGAADLLDQQAVQWMAQFLGYPLGDGHFTSGGQTSNLTAMLAAREQALPGSREHGMRHQEAAVYCSGEAHHSVVRAAEVAGLGRASVRRIATDDRRRMRADALDAAIAADLQAGVTPVAVVATAGTTLTGTVDPLNTLADVCQRHGVWLHVDGAYGLPAAASTIAGGLFEGLARADSLTVDAHKWMGMQKSCSAVLTRHDAVLRSAFGHQENYMLHDEDTRNPVDTTFEYSRPFRSLRLWLSMRVHGSAQFRTWIDQTLVNTARLTRAISKAPDLELLHDPMLSVVCFRHRPEHVPEADLDAHNQRLARALQQDGRVFIAPAELDGKTCLRVCLVNFRTTAEDVDFAVAVVREVGSSL